MALFVTRVAMFFSQGREQRVINEPDDSEGLRLDMA